MRILESFVFWIAKILRLQFWQKRVDQKVRQILDEAGEQVAVELGNRQMKAMRDAFMKAGGPQISNDKLVLVEGSYSTDGIVIRIQIKKGALYDAAVKEFSKRGIARRYLNGDLRIEANNLFTVMAQGNGFVVEMLELPPIEKNAGRDEST